MVDLHKYFSEELNKMSLEAVEKNINNVQEKINHLSLVIIELFGDNYEIPDAFERAMDGGYFTLKERNWLNKKKELDSLYEELENASFRRDELLANIKILGKTDSLNLISPTLPEFEEKKQESKKEKEVEKFPWEGTKSQLIGLFEELEKIGLIEKTDEGNIGNIFELSNKTEPFSINRNGVGKKIIWKGAEALLVFLFLELIDNKFLAEWKVKTIKFALIKQHFLKSSGKEFNNTHLAQTSYNIKKINVALEPNNSKLINNIISRIKENT